MSIELDKLTNIVEAALLAFGQPLSVDQLQNLFTEQEQVSRQDIREALQRLQQACEGRSVELVEVGSGFRYQARQAYAQWVSKLWEEKPPRYSRALLETLVLVAYRQPITRAEIEDIRGVSVSTHIMKTLQERDWVRVVGHKDVPGKPALYATTKAFLDYFNMKSLDELPSLMEIRDLDKISAQLSMQGEPVAVQEFAEEQDMERLSPDGEADHGEGSEEQSIAAVDRVLPDEDEIFEPAVKLSSGESSEYEHEMRSVAASEEDDAHRFDDSEIADSPEDFIKAEHALETGDIEATEGTDWELAPEYPAEDGLESAETESVTAERHDTHAQRNEPAEHPSDDEQQADEPRFSTAGYGLRSPRQTHDSDSDDFEEDERHPEPLSAAETNS